MNYTQMLFKVLEEERGYTVSHYVSLGYNRNTIKNWQRGKTSIDLNEVQLLLDCVNYSAETMLMRLAKYERQRIKKIA